MAAGEDGRPSPKGARRPGKRAGLDVDQIVAAARTLPLEDLSMQALADALTVDRKALHYHVKDRQSLFELVARDAFSQRLAQSGVADVGNWKDAARNYARSLAASAAALAELVDYLWFSDVMTDLPLEPVEALFKHLHEARHGSRDRLSRACARPGSGAQGKPTNPAPPPEIGARS
jgi:TetR/AcrR family transcriptional regulator, tetracycline repressor protein